MVGGGCGERKWGFGDAPQVLNKINNKQSFGGELKWGFGDAPQVLNNKRSFEQQEHGCGDGGRDEV